MMYAHRESIVSILDEDLEIKGRKVFFRIRLVTRRFTKAVKVELRVNV